MERDFQLLLSLRREGQICFTIIFITILKTYIGKKRVIVVFAHTNKNMGFFTYAHIYVFPIFLKHINACSDGITLK